MSLRLTRGSASVAKLRVVGPLVCEACGQNIEIVSRTVRPHKLDPTLQVLEVIARCGSRPRPHRYLGWSDHAVSDPETPDIPTLVRVR